MGPRSTWPAGTVPPPPRCSSIVAPTLTQTRCGRPCSVGKCVENVYPQKALKSLGFTQIRRPGAEPWRSPNNNKFHFITLHYATAPCWGAKKVRNYCCFQPGTPESSTPRTFLVNFRNFLEILYSLGELTIENVGQL